jgi:hypothetical protein
LGCHRLFSDRAPGWIQIYGVNGCNGNAAQVWYSEGTHPDASAANVNTFENLLGQKHSAQANHLFGIPDARAETVDPSYKGPYLSAETAKKTDPWGNAYLIVGYNAHGQRDKKGIYIVSGGPDGKIDDANAANPDAWGRGGNSADDFVVQVF